jgi:hypothetical protein
MTQELFPPIKVWTMPESIFQQSLLEMARDGRDGNEGVALWLGRRSDGRADISHLVLLRGLGVIKQPALLQIESWLLNEVTDLVIELRVALLGQIHSHGVGWPVDLSRTDRTYGLAVPWYLSLVAPDYALRSETHLAECGVHVFEPGSGYRRMGSREISDRVRLISGRSIEVVTVGAPA